MPEAAPATSAQVTPAAVTAPAAASSAPPPPATTEGAQAAADAAATPAPAPETQEQKMARLSRAARNARLAAAKNRELAAQNADLQARAQRATQVEQTTQGEMARMRELATKDPVAFAKAFGLDPKVFADAALREGTPEAQFEARIRAAEERAQRAEEAVRRREEQENAQQQAATASKVNEEFIKSSGDEKAYPLISKMPPEARLAWAVQVVTADRERARAMGMDMRNYQPTVTQIANHLEKLAAGQSGAQASKASPVPAPAESQNGSATSQKVTTVASAQTSAKYSLPANFDSLSDREQKQAMAAALRASKAAKRTATA